MAEDSPAAICPRSGPQALLVPKPSKWAGVTSRLYAFPRWVGGPLADHQRDFTVLGQRGSTLPPHPHPRALRVQGAPIFPAVFPALH